MEQKDNQVEEVEIILRKYYEAGKNSVIEALVDYMVMCSNMETNNTFDKIAYCSKFYNWYLKNQEKYDNKIFLKIK